jgi:hypothetical protein
MTGSKCSILHEQQAWVSSGAYCQHKQKLNCKRTSPEAVARPLPPVRAVHWGQALAQPRAAGQGRRAQHPGSQRQADGGRRGRAQAAAPQGIDVVYDPVGGTAFAEALKTINWGAQVLVIGFASGTIPKARPPGLRGRRQAGSHGLPLRKRVVSAARLRPCYYADGQQMTRQAAPGAPRRSAEGRRAAPGARASAAAAAARPRDGRPPRAQVSLNLALVKNATLHGVFWGSYMQHQPRVLRQSLEELLGWLGAGRISVPIFHRRAPPRALRWVLP